VDQPYYYPAPPPAPRWNGKTNGFSIAALTLSLFGCIGLLSVVFGVIGLRQSRRNGDKRGKVYAVAALCICGLWLAAIAVAVGVAVARDAADGPDRDAAGAIRGERSLPVRDLRAGDCIKDLDSQTGTRVDVLPCSSAHSSEVFATYDRPAGAPRGEAEATKLAEAGCQQRFPAYSGRPKPDPAKVFLFTARMEELGSSDHRGVVCIAHQLSGTTTGSLRR
jgi:hypothetical protein